MESKYSAAQVLKRTKRSNNAIFEELKDGNLERECIEELCVKEEALEAFEDKEKGLQWWYWKTKTCENLPTCNNEGTERCINLWGKHICECKATWSGQHCELAEAAPTFQVFTTSKSKSDLQTPAVDEYDHFSDNIEMSTFYDTIPSLPVTTAVIIENSETVCMKTDDPCNFQDWENFNGGCHQICKSFCDNGKYVHYCECFTGYELSCDRKSCSKTLE